MKASRRMIIVAVTLLTAVGGVGGCVTSGGGHDRMHADNSYTTEDPGYHRHHSHYTLLDRTVSGFGSH